MIGNTCYHEIRWNVVFPTREKQACQCKAVQTEEPMTVHVRGLGHQVRPQAFLALPFGFILLSSWAGPKCIVSVDTRTPEGD
jgi:hypothetical protein